MNQENIAIKELDPDEILDLYADLENALLEMADEVTVDLTSLVDDEF